MDTYVRDFRIEKIITYPLETETEVQEILKVNQVNTNF